MSACLHPDSAKKSSPNVCAWCPLKLQKTPKSATNFPQDKISLRDDMLLPQNIGSAGRISGHTCTNFTGNMAGAPQEYVKIFPEGWLLWLQPLQDLHGICWTRCCHDCSCTAISQKGLNPFRYRIRAISKANNNYLDTQLPKNVTSSAILRKDLWPLAWVPLPPPPLLVLASSLPSSFQV